MDNDDFSSFRFILWAEARPLRQAKQRGDRPKRIPEHGTVRASFAPVERVAKFEGRRRHLVSPNTA